MSAYLDQPKRSEAQAEYDKRLRKASDCFHIMQNRERRAKLCVSGAMAGSKLRGDERKAMINQLVTDLIPQR